jgi:RNA polymerase sigma factor (sigma-70 family)
VQKTSGLGGITMVKTATSPILRFIRNMVDARQVRELPDHELLQRFKSQQDQTAFQALVRRHGVMVFDVCRSVLGDNANAEDAFQATFLVLASKADSIRNTASVGSWMHGVAYRTALRARVQSSLRQKHEAITPARQASTPDDLSWQEAREILHQELNGLPERYRVPLVLCFLEGATQAEAAAHMKVAKSTLRVRLDQGRALLRKRLIRRGLGSSAILAVATLPASSSAFVSSVLITTTSEAAAAIATGGNAVPLVSAKVASLSQGVTKTMFIAKLKFVTTALLLAVAGFGAAVKLAALSAAEVPAAKKPAKQAAANQQAPRIPPTWKIGATLMGHDCQVCAVAFSPDGKRLASAGRDMEVVIWDVSKHTVLLTLTCTGEVQAIAFTPDGKSLVTASGTTSEPNLITFWDPETGKEQAVTREHTNPIHSLSFSLDGKAMISTSSPIDMTVPHDDRGEMCVWDLGTKSKIATMKSDLIHNAVVSHDCKRLLMAGSGRDGTVKLCTINDLFVKNDEETLVRDQVCCLAVSGDGKAFALAAVSGWSSVVSLWDFDTGKSPISFEHKSGSIRCLAFAPDGKTLVTGIWTNSNKEEASEKKGSAATGDLAGEVKFWDVATGELKQSLIQKSPVTSLAFSPDGRTLAVGLLHHDKLRLKKEGGFEPPPISQKGVVVLCELKAGKP